MIIQEYPDELDYVNATLHPFANSTATRDEKSFLGAFCNTCLRADGENYELLRPALIVLMQKYPADADRLRMERHDRGLSDESPVTDH